MSALSNLRGEGRALCLLGAGGHAKVCYEAATASGWIVSAVAAPAAAAGTEFFAGAVLGGEDELRASLGPAVYWLLAMGDLGIRRRVAAGLLGDPRPWGIVVHPRASVSPSAILEPGTVVMPNVTVNASAAIGRHAILNTGCVVEHDCRVGEGTHVGPNAVLTGGVAVGEHVLVGSGAVVLLGLSVGDGAVIGAGAVVTRDLPAGARVAGAPARPLPRR